MLLKLIKYEFKATYRFFCAFGILLLLIELFAVTAISNASIQDEEKAAATLVLIVFCGVIFSIAGMYICGILRFHKTLLGDEGYLIHTLPTNTGCLIGAKIITMFIWIFLIMALSVFVISSGIYRMYNEWFSALEAFTGTEEIQLLKFYLYLTILICFPFAAVENLTMIYACMSIGYSFKTHRKLKSFLIYIAAQYVIQTISSVITARFNIGKAVISVNYVEVYSQSFGTEDSAISFYMLLGILFSVLAHLILTAVMFFITRYFLKNKLNLL